LECIGGKYNEQVIAKALTGDKALLRDESHGEKLWHIWSIIALSSKVLVASLFSQPADVITLLLHGDLSCFADGSVQLSRN
jgi:hypothetical protein